MCVLWQRALQHPNLAVQRLGLRTFLQRDWQGMSPCTLVSGGLAVKLQEEVPQAFLSNVLFPALLHKDCHFGNVKSKAEKDFDIEVWRFCQDEVVSVWRFCQDEVVSVWRFCQDEVVSVWRFCQDEGCFCFIRT